MGRTFYKNITWPVVLLTIFLSLHIASAKAYAYGQARKTVDVNLATVDLIYATESPSQNLKNVRSKSDVAKNKVLSDLDGFFAKMISKIVSTFSS